MQTPISPLSHPPELFTRERRLYRMRQFLEVFESRSLPDFDPTLELVPIKVTSARAKSQAWTTDASR